LLLHLGFVGRTRDVDRDRHDDFGVQLDLDVDQAERLDRAFEFNHRLAEAGDAVFGERVDDVADRNRTIKLAGVRRLADQDDLLAVDVLGAAFGFATTFGVIRLDLAAVRFEQLAVGVIRAQRLVVGQQVIAGKAVLDVDDIADAAEFLDAFEQNDFHQTSPPYFTM